MGLVGDIVILPQVEAFTHRGTPITIGYGEKYSIDEFIPREEKEPIRARFPDWWIDYLEEAIKPLPEEEMYVVTRAEISPEEWKPYLSFFVTAEELESALGGD